MFIPLKKKYFEQFAAKEKTEEFRLYGKRWNERVCVPGRDVVLSCGYSGARLNGTIRAFAIRCFADVPVMRKIYPDVAANAMVACISITIP
jgi:hypothetical protein